jgi:hypothetical protein
MFFFFFGGSFNRLPPGVRRFINGVSFGALLTFYLIVQFRAPELFYLGLFLAPIIGLSFAMRTPRQPQQRRRTAPFEGRFDRDFDYQASAKPDQARASPAAEASDRALRLAGYDPESVRVRLEDIGLLIYTGGREPTAIARLDAVRQDASHIRPFIRLRSPLGYATTQRITFELTDAQGAIFYRAAEDYAVNPGLNLVAPNTWLPLAKLNAQGHWILQVILGKTRLAVHPFRWQAVTAPTSQPIFTAVSGDIVLNTDGELATMRAATERLRTQPLSLDDLLADQEQTATADTAADQPSQQGSATMLRGGTAN